MRLRYFILSVTSILLFLSACSTSNKKEFELNTSVSPSNSGSVSPENGFFNEGDSLEITATPNEHWIFEKWKGDLTGSDNPAKVEVNKDMDITAMFVERTYPLNLTISGDGTVSEEIIQQKSNEYPNGTLVKLTATPSDGWYFLEWSGDLTGTEPIQEIMISGETNVMAKFSTDMIKTFGGSLRDEGWSIVSTSDGGMVITGRSASNDGDFEGLSKGEYFSFVLKLSASGEKEWMRTLNGSDRYEQAKSIIQTQDDEYLITGGAFPENAESQGMGDGDFFVTKLNSSGDTEWTKYFGGDNYDISRDILEHSDRSIYVVGRTSSYNGQFQIPESNVEDSFLLKLTSDGSFQWVKSFGGTEDEDFMSVESVGDGGVVVAGYTYSEDGDFENLNNGLYDGFVMELNSQGNIEWTTMLGGSGLDYATDLVKASDGGFLITGNTQSSDGDFSGTSNSYIKTFVAKINALGEKEWSTVYEGDYSIMRGFSLVENDNQEIIATGFSNSNTELYHPEIKIDAQIMALKLNSSGIVEWFKTFSGNGDEYGYSATKSTSNSVIVTGSTDSKDGIFTSLNNGLSDIFILQLDDSGELIPFE